MIPPNQSNPSPAFPERRHLRPALARSTLRLAGLLANPTDRNHWSAERRQNEIRRIYGLPPKNMLASRVSATGQFLRFSDFDHPRFWSSSGDKTPSPKYFQLFWTLDSGCPGSPAKLLHDDSHNDHLERPPGPKPGTARARSSAGVLACRLPHRPGACLFWPKAPSPAPIR